MTARRTTSDLPRIVEEYHRQALVYHDFCGAVRNVIVSLLDEGRFKCQLSWRVKSLESVREKIARNGPKGKTYRRLGDVEDLAGIRLVFYLESDKRRFLSSLVKALTPSRLRTEEHRKESGYRATHVLVRLGRKRLALNEYRRFAGLKCEVQITSALFHAWSEVEHDILYKPGEHLPGLDRATGERLRGELNEAMERFIEPASDILEAVARRTRRRRGRPGAPSNWRS